MDKDQTINCKLELLEEVNSKEKQQLPSGYFHSIPPLAERKPGVFRRGTLLENGFWIWIYLTWWCHLGLPRHHAINRLSPGSSCCSSRHCWRADGYWKSGYLRSRWDSAAIRARAGRTDGGVVWPDAQCDNRLDQEGPLTLRASARESTPPLGWQPPPHSRHHWGT